MQGVSYERPQQIKLLRILFMPNSRMCPISRTSYDGRSHMAIVLQLDKIHEIWSRFPLMADNIGGVRI